MKKIIQIKNRHNGAVIFEVEAESVKEAVVKAVASGCDLRGSNLSDSDLRGSNLSGSDLSGSDLSYSNLSYSNLSYSNLSYSDLSYSDLSYSNLSYSNLSGSRGVIAITGLPYFICIWKNQVQAGCKIHTARQWKRFTKKQIVEMDGERAAEFYPQLLKIIELFCGDES